VDRYYFNDAPNIPCFGPYAEDIYAILGVGESKSLAASDTAALCLACIKALLARVKALEARA